MGIDKARETVADPEMLIIKQRALLHELSAQSNPNTPSISNGPPKIPTTWVLTCRGKDSAELETIFRTKFNHWWCLPKFSHVGVNLLLHFDIWVKRRTLEEQLEEYGIKMNRVFPDFEAAESLLGSSYFCRKDKEDAGVSGEYKEYKIDSSGW